MYLKSEQAHLKRLVTKESFKTKLSNGFVKPQKQFFFYPQSMHIWGWFRWTANSTFPHQPFSLGFPLYISFFQSLERYFSQTDREHFWVTHHHIALVDSSPWPPSYPLFFILQHSQSFGSQFHAIHITLFKLPLFFFSYFFSHWILSSFRWK